VGSSIISAKASGRGGAAQIPGARRGAPA
jgi:hypothetical protein